MKRLLNFMWSYSGIDTSVDRRMGGGGGEAGGSGEGGISIPSYFSRKPDPFYNILLIQTQCEAACSFSFTLTRLRDFNNI